MGREGSHPFPRLDGVYRNSEGVPRFQEAREPTVDEMQDLLAKIITRILRMLTRQGHLIEESGMTSLAHTEGDLLQGCRGQGRQQYGLGCAQLFYIGGASNDASRFCHHRFVDPSWSGHLTNVPKFISS